MSENIKEIALKAGRGAIGVIPGGSLISEFFETPKERRLTAYLEAFDKLVLRLEEDYAIDHGTLADRDDFLDILYGTISIWLVNSNTNKLEAIFNLLENVAINPSVDTAKDLIVLRFLRDLSGSHLHLVLQHNDHPTFCQTTEFREMLGPKGWRSDWGIVHNDLADLGIIAPEGLSPIGTYLLDRIRLKPKK